MSLRSRHARRGLGALLVGVALAGISTGCAAQRVRSAEAQGEHTAAVAAASKLARPPRGTTALALARSLVALDRVDEARSVLEVATRRGGDMDALEALARLELERGLLGTAAERYARLLRLDAPRVEGDAEACALWRARARAYAEQDEPIAADADLRRARRACGLPSEPVAAAAEAELFEQVRPAAEARVLARRTLSEALRAELRARDTSSLADDTALAAARAAGPREMLRLARSTGRSLAASDVVAVLAAELDGGLGVGLMSDDTVAALVGDTAPEVVVEAASSLDASARGYVALRVLRVRPLPAGIPGEPSGLGELLADPGAGAGVAVDVGATVDVDEATRDALTGDAGVDEGVRADEEAARAALADLRSTPPAGSSDPNVQGLLTLALSGEGKHPARAYHRAMLVVGDPSGAELVLVDRLAAALDAAGRDRCTGQPAVARRPSSADTPPEQRGRTSTAARSPTAPCTRPTLAAMLTLVDARHLPWLLDLSRLRERSGRIEDALTLRLSTLVRAREVGVADLGAWIDGEIRHALARGRPWTALSLAQLVEGDPRRVYEVVAGSMLELLDATCGAACSSGERVVVDRVVAALGPGLAVSVSGERGWSDEVSARARAAANADAPRPGPSRSCISARALLDERASGSLAALVRRTLVEGEEPSPAELGAVVERDPTRMCSAELAVALLARAGHTLAAETLSDRYAMLPQSSAARVLALEGDLALLAGELGRARGRWSAAAAESDDPREVWRRAALLADERGARELELEALRELERLSGARDATITRRALLVEQLAEIDVVVGGMSALDSAVMAVREHLDRLPESLRWSERQAILLRLATRRDLSGEGLALALAVLLQDNAAGRHGAALEVIAAGWGLAVEAEAFHGSPLAMAAATRGLSEALASAEVWLDGSELHLLSLARMRTDPDRESSARAAVAALHVGDAPTRAVALAWLMAQTRPAPATSRAHSPSASAADQGQGQAQGQGTPDDAGTPDAIRDSRDVAAEARAARRLRVARGATALDPEGVHVVPAVDDPEALVRIFLGLPLDAWLGLHAGPRATMPLTTQRPTGRPRRRE